MTLLVGDAAVGKTALLVRGVMPLLRRRRTDAAPGAPQQPAEGRLAFAERRRDGSDSPAEIVVFFDAWKTAPLISLHDHIDAALRVARIDPGWHRESLSDRVESLASRFNVRFLFIFDRFDLFLGRTVGVAHGGRLLEELVQMLNLPSHVNVLFAIRSEAREAFDRFVQRVSFVSPEVVQLSHWGAPEPVIREPPDELADSTRQTSPAEPSAPTVPARQVERDASAPETRRIEPTARTAETRWVMPDGSGLRSDGAPVWGSDAGTPSSTARRAVTAQPNAAPASGGPARRRWPAWTAGALICAALALAVFWIEPPSQQSPARAGNDTVDALPSLTARLAVPERTARVAAPEQIAQVAAAERNARVAVPESSSQPELPPLASVPADQKPSLLPATAAASASAVSAPAPQTAPASPALPKIELLVEGAATVTPRLPEQLARAMAPKGEVDLQVRVTANAIDALRGSSGEPQAAIVRYDELLAAGAARGASKPTLEVVTPLWPEEIVIVARADSPLRFIHQIDGARIDAGPAGSGRALTANLLYERMFGKPMPPGSSSSLDAQAALRRLVAGDGLDVVLLVGPQPMIWFAALPAASRRALRLLRFDAANPVGAKALQTYLPATLHMNGDLSGAASDQATPTLASLAFLVTTGQLDAARRETIRRFAQSFCRSLPALRRDGDRQWRGVQPGLHLDTGWPDSPAVKAASACSQEGAVSEAIDRRANQRATQTPPSS